MAEQSWIEQQKKIRLFRGAGQVSQAGRMLEISPVNRIVNQKGARVGLVLRGVGDCLGAGWEWINDFVDMKEKYDLTIGENKNSRQAFVDAIKAEVGRLEAAEQSKRFPV